MGGYHEYSNAAGVNGDGSNNSSVDSDAADASQNLDYKEPPPSLALTVPSNVLINPGIRPMLTNFAAGASVLNGATFDLMTPVVLTPLSMVNGQARLTIASAVGPDFTVQTTTDLVKSNWKTVLTTNSMVLPFTFTDTNIVSGRRFYRILLGP